MAFHLTPTDTAKLSEVHPDLAKVVTMAADLTNTPFVVWEGIRTIERQREYVERGTSWTMNSRHLTGHAVDLVPLVDGQPQWLWPECRLIAKAMKQAAAELQVPIEWGGDWKRFPDGPHFQLPRASYPASAPAEVAHEDPADEPISGFTLWERGSRVIELQRELVRAGYGLKIDGVYGPKTREAHEKWMA